jgi:hypothetical protein
MDVDLDRAMQIGAQVPLPIYVVQLYAFHAIFDGLSQFGVELAIVKVSCIDL